ncbi:MAG TPA: methionine aminotransferase [Flavobacteriales bacterium]|nr:methionine aminotransferase [Flavobacteriales bacterium]
MPKYPSTIHSKLPAVQTSIFAVMTKLANEHQAINLSQGFPGFDCAPELISLVEKHLHRGQNQYAPMPGIISLREAIAQKTEEMYSMVYDPETEITVTAGATQALYTAINALVREGEEVIIIEPAYDSYLPAIEMAGGKAVFFQLDPQSFKVNWNEFQKLVNPRTRMIIINTPHNPTGSMLNAADIQRLEKLTQNTDIIILSDEVYEHILFDGYEHQSVARFPKLAQRSVIISSFGKTYHTTGWKLGYCLAPANLMAEFRKVHQYLVFSVNTPLQYAYADFLKEKDRYLHLPAFYQEKRDFFNRLFEGSRFSFQPSAGTYFQLLNYQAISNEKDVDFARRLTIEHGVASIPVSVFYHKVVDNKLLRFCFAKNNDELERAAEKLIKL